VTVAAIRYSWRRFGDAWGMASVNLFGGLPGNWPLWLLGCAGGEDACIHQKAQGYDWRRVKNPTPG
jgi:hypothetical protein